MLKWVFGMSCDYLLHSLYSALYALCHPWPNFLSSKEYNLQNEMQPSVDLVLNQCLQDEKHKIFGVEILLYIKQAVSQTRPRCGKIHICYSHVPIIAAAIINSYSYKK